MSISIAEVDHVAHLARLGLTDEERERMARQLSAILDHMQVLARLDTSQIPPTAQVIPLQNVFRSDEVRPSWPTAELLANAPAQEENCFKIPAVLE